ncbi:hypothetical protein OROMI_028115 [Orobanche minor]
MMERFLDDLFTKRLIITPSPPPPPPPPHIMYYCTVLRLLSITVGCGDNAQELYKESLPLLSQALKSRTESLLLSVIDSLAIATFVGASDCKETEASMHIIWHFIHSNSGDNFVVQKHSAFLLSAAISAWSLLLTTVDGWNINHSYWHGAISYFLCLMEADDQSVCMAAGEAIALICEVGCLEKFSSNIVVDKDSSNEKGKNLSGQDYTSQELQEIVSDHAKRLASHTSFQSSAAKALNGWNNFSLNVLNVLEDGCFRETTLKIGKHSLQLHSLSQLLQVNFIKRLLGRGFVLHMLENEFLQDVFDFTPREQKSGNELYTLEREKVKVRVFVPETSQIDFKEDFLGLCSEAKQVDFTKSKNSIVEQAAYAKRVCGAEHWLNQD